MTKSTEKTQKVIKIPETKLIGIIENIVVEAVAEEKKKWLREQAEKQKGLTESKIDSIVEAKVAEILAAKFSK